MSNTVDFVKRNKKISTLLYISVALVALFSVTEFIIFDALVEGQDTHSVFLRGVSVTTLTLSIAILGLMVAFVFRPALRNIQATVDRMRLVQTVATAANEASNIPEGLQAAIDVICKYMHWPVGHAYLLDEAQGVLVNVDTWYLDNPERFQEFKRVSEGKTIRPREGFVGDVFADSTPMWILDVADSDIYLRKETAAACGLKAGFAFPVFIGRKAVAVIEFYSYDAEIPDEEMLEIMGNIGKQLGQVVERKEAEKRIEQTLVDLKRANLKAEAAARDMQESLRIAEEANKSKSDFLANMSHEIRTPMNGVLGMTHLLSDTPLSGEQKQYVSTITGSAETLLMLLNDILDFSKIEANALELENIPYDFKSAVVETANLIRPQADKKSVDLRVDMDSDVPSYLWGDPGRIRQLITNLLGNAVKFTEAGHVRIHVRINSHTDVRKLYVSVEDTGMGIPADKLDAIFEKFTQGDTSVTRKFGGTGLGLAITKHLVELMGGEVGVESAVGKGSTFWFSLPYKEAAEGDLMLDITDSESCSIVHKRVPISEAKILIVEDYPVNQIFAQKLLKKFGFKQIDLAENGVQALLKYQENRYDMIFMDCQMPELDGYLTTAEIRELETSSMDAPAHVPIVAMTANAMLGDREKCMKAGMDDYISKPLKPEHLRRMLQAWFIFEESTPTSETLENNADLPVDMSQLRIFTNGDKAEERELFTMFMDQANVCINDLQSHLDMLNDEAWKSVTHQLKGSSGNLGANHLHHLCKRAEASFKDPKEGKQRMLDEIRKELVRVQTFFEGEFAKAYN